MLIEKIVTQSVSDTPISSAEVGRLVSDIGRADFIEALMRFAKATAQADFVSVFCLGDRDTPLLIGTTSTVGANRARLAAAGYERNFTQDRNAALLTTAGANEDYLTTQHRDDILSFPYRRDCYERPGIVDRISLIRRRADYGLAVSLYRAAENVPFAEADHPRASAILAVMLAAVERHVAGMLTKTVWHGKDIQVRVALAYPDLTAREREVTAMTIKGRTAAEIAGILGLAETTIITHRKRAYQRMKVANLRELMAKF